MKNRLLLATLFLAAIPATTALAQSLLPRKDLAFAQVAAGGGYETVLNLTNRGTAVYNGTLNLFRSDGALWNPLVNGNPLDRGNLGITLNPGDSVTFRIALPDASFGAQSGFAIILDADYRPASLLEGNLTYYVRSGDGRVIDSVGISPSSPVFQSVIPFDDFSSVALALVKLGPSQVPARVVLTLYDEANRQVGTQPLPPLSANNQIARFLSQIFPGVTLKTGRVEIQSDLPILGTALTSVNDQLSSLPFTGALKAYAYTANVAGHILTGDIYFSVDGAHVTGYEHSLTSDGVDNRSGLDPVSGLLVGGNLEIFTHGGRNSDTEITGYTIIQSYNPSAKTLSGPVIIFFVNPPSFAGQGTMTITAIN